MSPPEIHVDQLMHQIRQAVAQRATENGRKEEALGSETNTELAVGQIDAPGLALQPAFLPSPTNEYHANDLLRYHGDTFVRNAYRAILLREPDSAGAANYRSALAAGRLNKIDVLARLRYSAEGNQAGVKIAGLAWPATIRKIERIPILGYLVQIMIAAARLPVLLRHQRQQEFYELARQEQIAGYVNGIERRVASNANEFSTRASTIENEIRAQRQTIEGLRGEVAATIAKQVQVESRIAELAAQLNQTAETLNASVQQTADALNATVHKTAETLDASVQKAAETLSADVQKRETALRAELATLSAEQHRLVSDLGLQEKRLSDLFELAEIQSGLNEDDLDELYVAFEDQFRGEREEIKERLRVYLPVLERAKVTQDILDLGCGRGEWLELLRDHQMQARGVDHNRIFIERCRGLKLDVVQRDGLAYLRDLPDASLNAVTSFHLVEHLPFKVLMQFLDEMVRVLRPGSPLILETPNPENFMVGSHTFYADPTHRNPIPSGTLQFLLESRGLTRIEVMKLRPWDAAKIPGDDELTKRFNEYFYSSPDYGIVGWKV